jgi:E3 ubiquitin-protein ligase listerin
MSKRQFKSQASSSRAASGTGFGGFGSAPGTTLSYLFEPPNFSSISDANVVVGFKNLSKKDGTTKSKALEDLRAYVQAHPYEQDGGTEEAILEAWVGSLSLCPYVPELLCLSLTYTIGQVLSPNLNRQFPSST